VLAGLLVVNGNVPVGDRTPNSNALLFVLQEQTVPLLSPQEGTSCGG